MFYDRYFYLTVSSILIFLPLVSLLLVNKKQKKNVAKTLDIEIEKTHNFTIKIKEFQSRLQ